MAKRRQPSAEALRAEVAELRRLVQALQAENSRLRARLRALGEALADESPPDERDPAAPGEARPSPRRDRPAWVKANVVRVARYRPRKPRAPVPGRRRAVPDRIVVHAHDRCPRCAAALAGGTVLQRRQVIVLPQTPAAVVEHRVLARRCRDCGRVWRGQMPDLRAEVGSGRRVAWDVAARVAVLRTKLRLPLRQLQWLVRTLWGLHLAVGELSGLCAEAARAGRGAYDGLLAEARASPVTHLDETGWREDGRNGWVWTVSTPTLRLFRRSRSRAGAVAEQLLGEDYRGVVVSDFFGAYDRIGQRGGVQQRCWAHLLRDVHDLTAAHPDDRRLQRWAEALHALYAEAVAWAAQATADGARPILRERARDRFEGRLVALCAAQPAASPQATLCQRVERYRADLFTFVADPAVPPTNNAAERALRPLVIARKVSGGTRSAAGTKTRMVLQSLVATWEVRGQDPIAELLALLRAPRHPTPELAPL
jgi:hypothetical protein